MFINLSNHGSEMWGKKQMEDARQYGEVVDLAFPPISVDISNDKMNSLVEEYLGKILKYEKPVVMLQGEFVFVYRLVTILKEKRIPVFACCSERISSETKQLDGSVKKVSQFVYGGLREY